MRQKERDYQFSKMDKASAFSPQKRYGIFAFLIKYRTIKLTDLVSEYDVEGSDSGNSSPWLFCLGYDRASKLAKLKGRWTWHSISGLFAVNQPLKGY